MAENPLWEKIVTSPYYWELDEEGRQNVALRFDQEYGGDSGLSYVRAKNLEQDGDFIGGVKQGVHQVGGLIGGAMGLVGDAVGSDAVRDKGFDIYQNQMEQASTHGGRVQRLEDIEGIGDAVDWLQGAIGTQVPTIASMALSGGVTGAIAKKALSVAAKEAVEKQIAKGLSEEVAKKVVAGNMARLGTQAGIAASGGAIESGGMWGEDAESQGVENANAGSAALLGGISGLSEVLSPVQRAASGLGFTRFASKAGDGLIARQLKQVPANAVGEFTQEVFQEAIGIGNKIINDPNVSVDDLFSPEAVSTYLNAGVPAAIIGGGFGAVGAIKKIEETPVEPPQTITKAETVDEAIAAFTEEVKKPGIIPQAIEPERPQFTGTTPSIVEQDQAEAMQFGREAAPREDVGQFLDARAEGIAASRDLAERNAIPTQTAQEEPGIDAESPLTGTVSDVTKQYGKAIGEEYKAAKRKKEPLSLQQAIDRVNTTAQDDPFAETPQVAETIKPANAEIRDTANDYEAWRKAQAAQRVQPIPTSPAPAQETAENTQAETKQQFAAQQQDVTQENDIENIGRKVSAQPPPDAAKEKRGLPEQMLGTSATVNDPQGAPAGGAIDPPGSEPIGPTPAEEKSKAGGPLSNSTSANVKDEGGIVKQPWEMTREEFVKEFKPTRNFQQYTSEERADRAGSQRLTGAQRDKTGEFFYTHPLVDGVAYRDAAMAKQSARYDVVKRALSEGKPVPASVLADYPDIAAKYGQQATPAPAQVSENTKEAQSLTVPGSGKKAVTNPTAPPTPLDTTRTTENSRELIAPAARPLEQEKADDKTTPNEGRKVRDGAESKQDAADTKKTDERDVQWLAGQGQVDSGTQGRTEVAYTPEELSTIDVDFSLFPTADGKPMRMKAKDALQLIDDDIAIYEKLKKCVAA